MRAPLDHRNGGMQAPSNGPTETVPVSGPSIVRSRLFIKYIVLFVAVVGVALVINGAFDIYFSYKEQKTSLIRVQREQAQAAASKIGQFINEIESQVGWTTQLPWSAGTLEQRRFDALRLLRQVPAITELAEIDSTGHEQLRVSRLAMEVVGSGKDVSKEPAFTEAVAHKVYYGPVYFRRESEPYMTLSLAGTRRDTGVSIAQVNLKLIWDVLSKIKFAGHGRAYVVDASGRLIAHPDISLVLRNTDVSRLAQVRSALSNIAGNTAQEAQEADDIDGKKVLTASAPVAPLGWFVFVETPIEEAYAPLYTTIERIGLVLLGALALAFGAGLFLARRMVIPIRTLRAGAARLGSGDLGQRIAVKTGDEVEALADQFNEMAGRLQESYANLEQKVEQRTRELTERTEELGQSVGELQALGEVSQAVNSTLDLETVLSTIVAKAVQLSGTEAGAIYVFNEVQRELHLRATYGMDQELIDALARQRIGLDETTVAQALAEGDPVQIADLKQQPSSAVYEIILHAGFRAVLVAPLLRGEEIVGLLVVRRRTPGTFPQNTIDLIKTFAAQSAVAIENARLFKNVQTSLEDLRTTQDRLVQTQKLASLGQLTAGIAHEIKNPLNFVNNFSGVSVELIDELQEALVKAKADDKTRAEITELTDTLRDNLGKIVQHGRRADSIVKNMLLHSREGSGEHRPVDINALVEEAVNLAYHGARAEKQGFNITLERSLDAAAGQVDCFPQEITRVLLNLISNGFYAATKRKALAISDGYEPTLAAATKNLGDRVEISIRDNGTGIPPEVREKMFNPFFTTKPAGEGTGLGLSLSHDIIVKQHSGSIEVDTQPGEFTEFRIVLPRAGTALIKSGERT
jgi:signal transduction histidine kinase